MSTSPAVNDEDIEAFPPKKEEQEYRKLILDVSVETDFDDEDKDLLLSATPDNFETPFAEEDVFLILLVEVDAIVLEDKLAVALFLFKIEPETVDLAEQDAEIFIGCAIIN